MADLSNDAISTILSHISDAIGKTTTLNPNSIPIILSSGRRRTTYRFYTDQGDYIIYIGSAKFDQQKEFIQEQSKFHKFLNDHYAPVPKLICPSFELPSGQYAMVTEFIHGKEAAKANLEEMKEYGRSLARFHLLKDDYFAEKQEDPDHFGSSWRYAAELSRNAMIAEDNAVKKVLSDGIAIPKATMTAVDRLRQVADESASERFSSGLAHNDAHAYNVMINVAGKAVLLDLETAKRGVPLRDLAFAMLWSSAEINLMGGPNITFKDDHARALMKGYESVIPLLEQDKNLVWKFIKNESRSRAAMGELAAIGLKWTPEDYNTWSDNTCSWVDRISQSEKIHVSAHDAGIKK